MKNIRIKHIRINNFKGFSNLDIEFSGSAIILGGMNGYGKTTIFDAIELLLSGKIQRLNKYSLELINHRFSRSQTHIPLVCDMTKPVVSITAEFVIDGKEIVLRREASVSEMRNPIDFKPFAILQKYDNENNCYTNITDQERQQYGMYELEKDYGFLNYLSQEESTAFLKCRDEARSDMIQALLDTAKFDLPMNKIIGINKTIDKTVKILSSDKNRLENEIKQLQQIVGTSSGSTDYIALTINQAAWDIETPQMSFEEFNSWISENGNIDGLKYYVNNESSFKQYNRNNTIAQLQSDGVLNDIVFYLQNKEKESTISSYSAFRKSLFEPIAKLTSDTLQSLNIISTQIPPDIVSEQIQQQADNMINSYLLSLSSANNIQRIVQDLLEARTTLSNIVQDTNNALNQTKCPLCGSTFNSPDELCETIKLYETELNNSFASLDKGLSEQFTQLKEFLIEKIVNPLKGFFVSQGITEQIVNRFNELNRQAIEKHIQTIIKLGVTFDILKTESECVVEIVSQLNELTIPIDNGIDVQLLQKMYNSFVKDIDADKLTCDNLEKKREYLIYQWNKTQSVLLSKKQKECDILSYNITKLSEKKNKLKELNGRIKQQKNQYVTKVISDIQILFYVYSGRILQDSYFGRGLFLKSDMERKRILFISKNYNENDVDALYNMSSGQLVAVAIAFMLSLNRLYSTNNVIAIDDPVQTIDDINLWGLMETLRHDFKDHFLLLSTHESNYGQLMDYKFRKIGIASEYVDMADLHKNYNLQL